MTKGVYFYETTNTSFSELKKLIQSKVTYTNQRINKMDSLNNFNKFVENTLTVADKSTLRGLKVNW